MEIALFENGRMRQSWTYEEYRKRFKKKAAAESADELPEAEQEYFEYYQLNFQRSKRLEENYSVSKQLQQAVEAIEEPQTWVVLTEPWCGDSAQILPALARAAALSEKVSFRILPRDKNLDIMDQYLTDGKRGIPKLVVFDNDGQELFSWGPRPEPVQGIFVQGVEENKERSDIYQEMQTWYNEDKGATVDAELAAEIEQVHSS